MAVKYKIVLDGRILADVEIEQVLVKAGKLLKLDTGKVERLLQGKPRTIKQNLDRQTAQKYLQAISAAGMSCNMEPYEAVKEIIVEKTSKAFKQGQFEEESKLKTNCLQCGYSIDSNPKTGPPESCPICGFIINKPKAPPFDTNRDPPDKTVEDSSIPEIQDVPKVARISAGFGSFSISGFFIGLCYLAMAVVAHKMNRDFLSKPLPDEIWVDAKLSYINETLLLYLSVIGLLILIFYYIIYPSVKGGTWVQRLIYIKVVHIDPKRSMNPLTWIIRATSQCIYILPFVLSMFIFTLIKEQASNFDITLSFGIGVLLNLPLLSRKDTRSIPDIISGTHQIVEAGIENNRIVNLWAIVPVCLIVSFSAISLGHHLVTPPDSNNHKSAVSKQIQNTSKEI